MASVRCELCGGYRPEQGDVLQRIHNHHYNPFDRDCPVGEVTKDGVVQKIIKLCYSCHLDWVHHKGMRSEEKFRAKWNKEMKDFIYIRPSKIEAFKRLMEE